MDFRNQSIFKRKGVIELAIFSLYFTFVLYETYSMLSRYTGEDKYRLLFLLTGLWSGWAYFYTRIIVDSFLLKGKIPWFILQVILGILAIAVIQHTVLTGTTIAERNDFTQILISDTIFTILTTLVYLGVKYLLKSKEFFELEAVKKEVELNQLKNQLNPHFLFNALNNIYSYGLENNQYGHDLVMKLGQLMRFVLDANKSELIPLGDEVNFIDNYIAFEQERLGYRCRINFSKEITDPGQLIPPFLLFPLIENAFKHGTNSVYPTTIDIHLVSNQESVQLMVKNEKLKQSHPSTQTGLSNLTRRLQLLYPAQHQLTISETESHFHTSLSISFP